MKGQGRYKIAVGGLHIECSNFNPTLTKDADFELLTGERLLKSKYFEVLQDYSVEFVPTLYAHALPGAPIAAKTYARVKSRIVDGLRAAGPIDGVYLMMHGAAYVEGKEDAEGDLLSAVRDAVGPSVPIAVSYDLHGNISDRVMNAIDMFAAYRTAPHIDVRETHERALNQLIRCLETGQKPHLCWCPIPVVLPGERTSTEDQPARDLYAGLPAIDMVNGIWDASLMVGYVWVDEPRISAAAVVVGTHQVAMERAARELAQDYWAVRKSFVFGSPAGTIEACIEEAMTPGENPFVLADSGDNPTGGGVGDRVDVLRALLNSDCDGVVLAGIADKRATEAAFAVGEHASLRLCVGGTLDTESTRPINVDAQVVALIDGAEPGDRQAVLRSGGITFVTTEKRRPFHYIADFQALGLDPAKAKILVVKSGYLVPEIAQLAARNMMALSPGVVDQAVERQPRHRSGAGIYPFEDVKEFAPHVRWSNSVDLQ